MKEGVRHIFECIVRFPCPVCGDVSVQTIILRVSNPDQTAVTNTVVAMTEKCQKCRKPLIQGTAGLVGLNVAIRPLGSCTAL
jgi:hypothetical protein